MMPVDKCPVSGRDLLDAVNIYPCNHKVSEFAAKKLLGEVTGDHHPRCEKRNIKCPVPGCHALVKNYSPDFCFRALVTQFVIFKLIKNADEGDVDSSIELAKRYASGQGIEKNATKAFEYADKAEESKRPQALMLLADFHERGIGTPVNIERAGSLREQAVEILEEGVNQKNRDYMFQLAELYMLGFGIEKSYEKAMVLLTVLAESDYPDAGKKLAFINEKFKKKGLDPDRAVQSYLELEKLTELANGGDVDSCLSLSFRYLHGQGVEKDAKQAFDYLKKVEKSKKPEVLIGLAQSYEIGSGTEIDIPRAEKLKKEVIEILEQGVKQQNFDYTLKLAELHIHGYLVEKNYEKAFKLLTSIIESSPSYPKAQEVLAGLKEKINCKS